MPGASVLPSPFAFAMSGSFWTTRFLSWRVSETAGRFAAAFEEADELGADDLAVARAPCLAHWVVPKSLAGGLAFGDVGLIFEFKALR